MDTTEVDVFAVGDPDQSIYGFAGADPKYLREMAADHGVKQVQLGMNYRSAQEIIDSSQVALAVDPPRAYESARKGASGELGFLECQNGITEQARTIAHSVIPSLEHRGVAKGQIAVLYIDRADALVLTRALDDAGIQFAGERDHRYQRTPFTRWLEDVAVWCSLFPATQEGPEFEEIFHWYANAMAASYPSIAINDLAGRTKFFEALTSVTEPHMLLPEWLGRLDHLLELENCLTALPTDPSYIANWEEINKNCQEGGSLMGFRLDDFARCGGRADTVTLTTLHSSKGLEYEAVIIPGLEQGRLPDFRATSPEALEEARRVFYVGMTRAKDTVYLLYSGWYENQFGRKFKQGPSQFVQELQARTRSRTDVVSL
jgi:DNA helicase-2/ATP-dependent DNA helicase PcrA